MTDQLIKVGIVGAGYIADWHADALRAIPDVHLSAVCDVSKTAAATLADPHGARVFTSFNELANAQVCDAVHILTPPGSHCALALEALENGLHCFVEKPLALTTEEALQINKKAQETDCTLAVGHNFMGLPGYKRLKNLINAGTLGRISSIEVNWHLPLSPLRSGPFGLWMLREDKNLLLEIGPHLFGFVVDLFGRPNILDLSTGKPITMPGGAGVRHQSWRVLAETGDVDVTCALSLVETADDRSVIVRGSSGIANLDFASDVLTFRIANTSDIIVNPFRQQISSASQHLYEGIKNAGRQITSLNRKSPYGLSFRNTVEAFYNSVRDKSAMASSFSGANGVDTMRAIEDTIALLPPVVPPTHATSKRAPKPSVLVIGGTGFIGRALTRELVAQGRHVRVLSRGKSGPFEDLAEHVQVMPANLHSSQDLNQAMEGIEAVYHLGKSLDATWEGCLKNDVGVTVSIAEAALSAGVKNFVYTGTIASYDMSKPEQVITEETGFTENMTDRNLYARSKAECERRLLSLQTERGLPLTIARPGIVVGKGGPLQHWGIGRWHGAGAVRIWGHGQNILPFVLIDDVIDALVRIIETDKAIGQSFNLIGEPMLSARAYFEAIHDRIGAKIRVSSGNLLVLYLGGELKYLLKRYVLRRKGLHRTSLKDWKSRAHFSRFDNSHATGLLDWQPERSVDVFLDQAVDDANLFGF